MRRILWFRRDLRVEDNPLLSLDGEVFPIFIFDKNILNKLHRDDRRVSMIFYFVSSLKVKLQKIGLDLKIFYGDPIEVFKTFELSSFDEVVASGDYDEYAKERDRAISLLLHFRYINDTYLLKPKEVLKKDGSPYLVFTPFYKAALPILEQKELFTYKQVSQKLYEYSYESDVSLSFMGFNQKNFSCVYKSKDVDAFFHKIAQYQEARDYLDKDATSHLSVALRFGLISIRELYRRARGLKSSEAFIRQLVFRDFYAYLLFHFPSLAWQNHKGKFNGVEDEERFEKFCSAATGVPIVDAGVRELLQTGDMHNRVRMIVASFFTKDLLLPWQWGEQFFAKYLLDYDAASNILSWQWSAGTGIDPQPYFRVFNPYLQSKKFDKDAKYIKRFLPELKNIDAKDIHNEVFLFNSDIKNYPKPVVEHKSAARIAIESFKKGVYSDV